MDANLFRGASALTPPLSTHIRRLKRRRMSSERFHVIRRRVMSRENFRNIFAGTRATRNFIKSDDWEPILPKFNNVIAGALIFLGRRRQYHVVL